MAAPHQYGGTARWVDGGVARLLHPHRLITLALALYLIVDKGFWLSRSWAEVCEVDYASASPTWSDQRLLNLGAVIEPDLLDLDLWDQDARAVSVAPAQQDSGMFRLLGDSSSPNSSGSSSSSTNSTASSDGSSHAAHHSHIEQSMFFLIISLIIGVAVSHILTLPRFEGMQYTVFLFISGILFSFVLENSSEHLGAIGNSYVMWMEIDPHLLLFVFLPPLVTGDSMSIDTSIAKRVAKQCLYLAGPGVCINGFLTAGFLYVYLPYDWPFLLCLCSGAILCATDPVAVVGLLKELGASPTLTVQIQGESLLNDGTAIVMYSIAYKMLCGETFDVGDIIQYLVQMALYAWGLGMAIGFLFFIWIRLANKKLHHTNVVVQVALTLCCAYTSFIIAEGYFKISGVLATVAAALVLAHKMWQEIISKKVMHTVWHMWEYLGNTIIFFLAGALTGKTMLRIKFLDYIHLLVIYFAISFFRGALLFASLPLLKKLGPPPTVGDTMVMTWGGLRGAIGLALAIQVEVDKGQGRIAPEDADRVLFYVSGIASMTLIINASTCPRLVNWLGITQLPETRKKMLQVLNRQMVHKYHMIQIPERVQKEMDHLLVEVEHHVRNSHEHEEISESALFQRLEDMDPRSHRKMVDLDENDEKAGNDVTMIVPLTNNTKSLSMVEMMSSHWLKSEILRTKQVLAEFGFMDLKYLEKLSPLVLLDQEKDMLDVLVEYVPNPQIQRGINEAFLAVLRMSYWDLLERDMFPEHKTPELLFTTVTLACSSPSYDLNDWLYLEPLVSTSFADTGGDLEAAITFAETIKEQDRHMAQVLAGNEEDIVPTIMMKLIESLPFHFIIAVSILSNCIVINVESAVRGDKDEARPFAWFVSELAFNGIFLVEFIFKATALRCTYFQDAWNIFDFVLVIFGLVGTGVTVIVNEVSDEEASGTQSAGSEARLVRVAQIFRMMRIMRLFRLVRFWRVFQEKVFNTKIDVEVAEHMQKSTLLTNFIRAHTRSQELLVEYFGHKGKVDSVELTRCVLQSQLAVYKAIALDKDERKAMHPKLLEEVNIAAEAKEVGECLERFVVQIHEEGVINAGDAHNLLVPIEMHVDEFQHTLSGVSAGKLLNIYERTSTNEKPIWESGDTCLQKKRFAFNDGACPMIIRQLVGFTFKKLPDPNATPKGEVNRDTYFKSHEDKEKHGEFQRLTSTDEKEALIAEAEGRLSCQRYDKVAEASTRLSATPSGNTALNVNVHKKGLLKPEGASPREASAKDDDEDATKVRLLAEGYRRNMDPVHCGIAPGHRSGQIWHIGKADNSVTADAGEKIAQATAEKGDLQAGVKPGRENVSTDVDDAPLSSAKAKLISPRLDSDAVVSGNTVADKADKVDTTVRSPSPTYNGFEPAQEPAPEAAGGNVEESETPKAKVKTFRRKKIKAGKKQTSVSDDEAEVSPQVATLNVIGMPSPQTPASGAVGNSTVASLSDIFSQPPKDAQLLAATPVSPTSPETPAEVGSGRKKAFKRMKQKPAGGNPDRNVGDLFQ